MELELILILVIVGVLVVDLIINARKKSPVDQSVKKITSTEESKSKSKFSFDFIIKRKRNIVSFVILVHILKICIHYFMYNSKPRYSGLREIISNRNGGPTYDFTWHIEHIYHIEPNGEVWLFIPSFIILAVIVWLVNDKIKAR